MVVVVMVVIVLITELSCQRGNHVSRESIRSTIPVETLVKEEEEGKEVEEGEEQEGVGFGNVVV